jgi:peptidoglycan biosynthesis protein MviN/MurJ (putative lipid II flippase)
MLIGPHRSDTALVSAAALVHSVISLFWASVLTWVLPRRHTFWWAMAASVGIAVLDLRIIARGFFPEVHALPFWPQFADHLAWGATVGVVLQVRFRTHP